MWIFERWSRERATGAVDRGGKRHGTFLAAAYRAAIPGLYSMGDAQRLRESATSARSWSATPSWVGVVSKGARGPWGRLTRAVSPQRRPGASRHQALLWTLGAYEGSPKEPGPFSRTASCTHLLLQREVRMRLLWKTSPLLCILLCFNWFRR